MSATQLELLLGQHRRIVQSLPAEVDRVHLTRSRSQLHEISTTLQHLTDSYLLKTSGPPLDEQEQKISQNFPLLFRLGDSVAFYAYNFAQDKALEVASEYADVARRTEEHIRSYRELRLNDALASAADLRETAKSLFSLVIICTIAAICLIGPVGFGRVHNLISRLTGVTAAMAKIAEDEHTITVPGTNDVNEVGQIARAVEVFKKNAISLRAREVELAHLNRRLDVALNNMTHGLCMFDAEERLIVCNLVYSRMYHLPSELTTAGPNFRRSRLIVPRAA